MDKIIIRTNVLNRGHVNSAFIGLCEKNNYNSTQEFLTNHSLKVVMKKLFCEELSCNNLKESNLYKNFELSLETGKDNDSFIVAYKIDNEFAVHLTDNIYLYHIIEKKDNIYFPIVPWYYADSKKYIGDTWWEQDDEILYNLRNLPIFEFLKVYKGY